VLDNVAGSGTTGAMAALNTNRNYILMEKEPEYVEIIKQRLADHNDKPARQTKLLP
jgi:DNA modification methylase